MKTMMKNFRAPGAEFRGAPFWAWNAKLEKEELIRQIRIFKKMGMGGFFMHSRVGLKTPYLSDEWFDCVRSCVSEAKKLGLLAYLYDEDRWPSGSAGGIVTKDDRCKSRWCAAEFYADAKEAEKAAEGETVAWYSAAVSGNFSENTLKIHSPKRLGSPAEFRSARGRRLLRFAVRLMPNAEWYNGQTYLDTLNPDAVRKFVEVTHEAYFREIGPEFGKSVPAIFSDEPMFFSPRSLSTVILPWTGRLPEKFQARYAADIRDCLPEIFFPSVRKKSARRLQYVDLITEMFCQAFAVTIGEWCARHDLRMTGHVMSEDTLRQSLIVGSAMRFYESMQMPGIDVLTEHWRVFNTVKQCTSVAHQFGRKWRLSETYGCTGWDFSFAGHKALGDWQYALGINFRCPHLAWYSAEAEAKRDYPASISYQSPWCDKYRAVEDYFARLGAVLSEGGEMCELLVIHPIESAWMSVDPAWLGTRSFRAENRRHARLTDMLLAQKLDFDFGDEAIIARYGRVRDGKIVVNRAAYRAVLIPPLLTIRSTTLDLLRRFAARGGTVVYLGNAPRYLDGAVSDRPKKIFSGFVRATPASALERLGKIIRRVSVTDPSGRRIRPVLARLSDTGKAYTLFLCNYGIDFRADLMQTETMVRDRKRKFPRAAVSLTVPQRGQVYELDLSDGTVCRVDSFYEKGQYRFETAFEELGSHLFLVTAADPGRLVERKRTAYGPARGLPPDCWDYRLDEPNVLVLDHADASVDGEAFGKNRYILSLDDDLRRALGKPPRGGSMCQPWAELRTDAAKKLALKLTYSIAVGEVPKSDCLLAVEHPEFYRFEWNGRALRGEVKRWWFDRSLSCIAIPKTLLKRGDNILTLHTEYHENLPGLEAMFLLGIFGVSDDTVTALPEFLNIGDWCGQGLPYYAGNVTYSRIADIPSGGGMLEFPDWNGVCLGVRVDDGGESLLPWPPYRTTLPEGRHRLAVTVYGSRRNAMGPFYCETPYPQCAGPAQFRAMRSEKRQLVPCGLLKAPVVKKAL